MLNWSRFDRLVTYFKGQCLGWVYEGQGQDHNCPTDYRMCGSWLYHGSEGYTNAGNGLQLQCIPESGKIKM